MRWGFNYNQRVDSTAYNIAFDSIGEKGEERTEVHGDKRLVPFQVKTSEFWIDGQQGMHQSMSDQYERTSRDEQIIQIRNKSVQRDRFKQLEDFLAERFLMIVYAVEQPEQKRSVRAIQSKR